jgi:hypothetical protein
VNLLCEILVLSGAETGGAETGGAGEIGAKQPVFSCGFGQNMFWLIYRLITYGIISFK